jgi:putative hydrolase of the HAD superfamily
MNQEFAEVIRRHMQPLAPISTGATPRLSKLPGIRAVLFDLYGTLLVSGCGEVGTAVEQSAADAVSDTFREIGMPADIDAQYALETQKQVIHDIHARLREQGIDCPEVDIVDVWRETLSRLREGDAAVPPPDQVNLELLALTYESRTNPVWPMPHAAECLSALRDAGLTLGIVSNAQFFTPPLFPALFSGDLSELGFDADLCFFSWRYGVAKPSRQLFGLAAEALRNRGISSHETLYAGNDMLNDVAGAARVGFSTALFAGDARSLRLREGDGRTAGIVPDLQLTDLSQMQSCVTP